MLLLILCITKNNKRQICEALEIEKQPKKFNKDDGLILSESWKPILNLLERQQPTVKNPCQSFSLLC